MVCITSPVQTVQLRRDDRRNGDQQARPSTSFDDNTTDTPRRNLLRPDFATKFQERSGLLGIQTVHGGWVEDSGRHAKRQLHSSSFDTLPVCDRQRRTQGHSNYRARMASRGKKKKA